MPAKKKASPKKAIKKKTAAKKKLAQKAAPKKAVKKVTVKKKAVKKAATKKQAKKQALLKPIEKKTLPPVLVIVKKPEKVKKPKQGISCDHCDATGVCAAGAPYDKSRGQLFGAKTRLTSCVECLHEAGAHKNSKKLIACRLCDGDGEI